MGQNRTGRKGSQSPEAEKTPETEAPRNSQSNRFGWISTNSGTDGQASLPGSLEGRVEGTVISELPQEIMLSSIHARYRWGSSSADEERATAFSHLLVGGGQ